MKVDLFISGRQLKDLDVFSKSDPQCRVFELINGQYIPKGRTEQINNNLNPNFSTRIVMDYYFEKSQKLKFVMIDGDCASHDEYDLIGEFETTMGNIMGAKA